jgi:hypothetical protein
MVLIWFYPKDLSNIIRIKHKSLIITSRIIFFHCDTSINLWPICQCYKTHSNFVYVFSYSFQCLVFYFAIIINGNHSFLTTWDIFILSGPFVQTFDSHFHHHHHHHHHDCKPQNVIQILWQSVVLIWNRVKKHMQLILQDWFMDNDFNYFVIVSEARPPQISYCIVFLDMTIDLKTFSTFFFTRMQFHNNVLLLSFSSFLLT